MRCAIAPLRAPFPWRKEDLRQEGYRIALEFPELFAGNPNGLAVIILRRKVIHVIRKWQAIERHGQRGKRQPKAPAPWIKPAVVELLDRREHVAKLLARLKPADRQLVHEYIVEGRLIREIAARHHCSHQAVSQRWQRILKQLRRSP